MRKTILSLLAVAAAAAMQADSRWDLITLQPFPLDDSAGGAWQRTWLSSLYQTGGGFAASGNTAEQPASTEKVNNKTVFRLVEASWGFGVSELQADFNIGEYCTDFPSGRIDWVATQAAIESSQQYRDGYLYYVDTAVDEEKRILFTRGGEVTVPWKLVGNADASQVYTIGQTTAARPYRIFWTEKPFNGPKIDLSAHPHVQLLGDPAIVKPVYEATATSATTGVSNLVRGVVFDADSKTLRCYCRVIDEARKEYDGPQGQFVLAYYDTGLKDTLVATVVVEACSPDVETIDASVGDELRPTGGGYDIEGLESEIVQGANAVTGDDASPYLYKHAGESNWSKKHKSVFALSPTDATTTKNGVPAPWRADIYWKAPDPLDTLWPFEEDWYKISWPEDAPAFIVSDDSENPGIPIFIPTNYTATLCDYQSPALIAKIGNDNSVSATEPGHFTIRLSADDNIWFQPVRAVSRTDPAYAMESASKIEIGSELKLLGGAAALNTSNAVLSANSNIPGYVYEPASAGRENWNPRLYHQPRQSSAAEDLSGTDDGDPYASLKSAIYLVNTSKSPVEVWWYSSVWKEDMPSSLEIPCVVQKYEAVWPDDRDTQDIVIASRKGSNGLIAGASNKSMYLNVPNETAGLGNASQLSLSENTGYTFGIWLNVSPTPARHPDVTDGLIARLSDTDGGTYGMISLRRDGDDGYCVEFDDTGYPDVSSGSFSHPIPTNEWHHFALAMDPATNGVDRSARLYVDAAEMWSGTIAAAGSVTNLMLSLGACVEDGTVTIPAATGVAVDEICVWSCVLSDNDLRASYYRVDGSAEADIALQCYFCFDDDLDLSPIVGTTDRFAFDSVRGRILVCKDVLAMRPGAPELKTGLMQTCDDVKPEIYYENASYKCGFNPNDEHAFLLSNPQGWEVHALRCDLADPSGSEPYVLAMYNDNGKGAMRVYDVKLTNEYYTVLGTNITAGLRFTQPYPLNVLDQADNAKNYAKTVTATAPTNSFGEVTHDIDVVYYDHYNRMWGRRDGDVDAYYYYAFQNGFWFPGVQEQPAVGTLVPWLCRAYSNNVDLISGAPMPWRWNVAWPSDDEIGTMRVAQTLTKASDKLPEVWNASSMAVVFPAPETVKAPRERVVHLIDPTVLRSEPLAIKNSFPDEYAFTLGTTGTTQLKKGKYYFTGLPPSIADRFYVDAANQRMCLIGQRVENVTGEAYMQINVLTPAERQAIKDICKKTGDRKTAWDNAADAIARKEVEPSPQSLLNGISNTYEPVDHYALVASGEGTGYVTLIENDCTNTAMVAEGSPISMHIIKVVPELYAGGLTVLTDPMNKLSEQLTITYNDPFGDAEEDFQFEWRRIETQQDGSVPTDYPSWREYGHIWDNLSSILLGAAGADLKDLQNMYYVMRYRARPDTPAYQVTGDTWSDWCGPTLAEGWIQRVFNSVTPFAQRCADFSNYKSDIAYSMLEQIGRPYEGDVALNNDNLNEVGLLELYRTVLNRAESMSLKLGQKTDAGVNKQLLLAASRIAELYGILGDEAYSDAKNPTISQMFRGTEYDYDSLSPSAFAFQNQVPTLLDEELALLRGRTSAVAPNMTTAPYYNRLIWNFTKDPCEGEVAYVNNYMIRGEDGEISEAQAAKQYPQGHGDAYGHYLSEVKSFYHLVRNEFFDWYASMTEMLIGGSVVNVDYFDEEKLAAAAGDLAKTARDAMDLTARKAWKESGGVSGAGYLDADATQGFGYGEWATRGGYGALCNWAVVNSLLPTNGTPNPQVFTDNGIRRITRETASSLEYLPTAVADIERKLISLDSGLNPLGLSDNAIPFDLDPNRHYSDSDTPLPHFEQIRERAEKALANAQAVLDYAGRYGSRLAQIQLDETDAEANQEEVEADYNKRLIAIYGTPYSGDIGPGKLYEQGYDGPDIYHYQYIDLSPYGLNAIDSQLSRAVVLYKKNAKTPTSDPAGIDVTAKATISVEYTLTPDGIPQPASDMGTRRTEGSIQTAYRNFISAYAKLKITMSGYDTAYEGMMTQVDIAKTKLRMAASNLAFNEAVNAATIVKAGIDLTTGRVVDAMALTEKTIADTADVAIKSTPKIIGAGLTINTDPSAVVGAVSGVAAATGATQARALSYGAKAIAATYDFYLSELKTVLKGVQDGFDYYDAEVSAWERLKSAVSSMLGAAKDLEYAYYEVAAAEQAYRTQIAVGDTLREELEMRRRHWANTATRIRYADMYNRIQRNNALSKYATAYDTAQRYVFELAKVYDYETGLLSSDAQAGDAFLRDVIASRSLGEKGIATDAGGTLWDAVTRMSRNWDDSLKGRLGVNNPENSVKWFSLRWSLLRIKPDASGDEAWREALRKYWKEDILSDPEFSRYCQPPESDNADIAAEPGLVIPFSTSVNLAENFFGKPLIGGDDSYSSSDYAVKIHSVGLKFDGYDRLTVKDSAGLAKNPNVYLVPVGHDKMRTPAGTSRKTLAFNVVDQVLPLPYTVGSAELDDPDWVSTFSGLHGTADSYAVIRRHSTMPVSGEITSTRLFGRSVWNDRWLLVIPASSLSSDRQTALKAFINGLDSNRDGMIDVPGVSDIQIGLRAYSRSGN